VSPLGAKTNKGNNAEELDVKKIVEKPKKVEKVEKKVKETKSRDKPDETKLKSTLVKKSTKTEKKEI